MLVAIERQVARDEAEAPPRSEGWIEMVLLLSGICLVMVGLIGGAVALLGFGIYEALRGFGLL